MKNLYKSASEIKNWKQKVLWKGLAVRSPETEDFQSIHELIGVEQEDLKKLSDEDRIRLTKIFYKTTNAERSTEEQGFVRQCFEQMEKTPPAILSNEEIATQEEKRADALTDIQKAEAVEQEGNMETVTALKESLS